VLPGHVLSSVSWSPAGFYPGGAERDRLREGDFAEIGCWRGIPGSCGVRHRRRHPVRGDRYQGARRPVCLHERAWY